VSQTGLAPAYPMLRNRLTQRLAEGAVSLCLRVVSVRTTEIAFMAHAAGFDALYVDLEHCTASLSETGEICATATALGLAALVRVPSHDDPATTKLLDAGAAGIIAPHVDTAEQARIVVDACKFAPLGRRSAAGPTFQLGYASLPLEELARRMNELTIVVVMLETEVAIRNAESIAAVEGVDMLLIGTTDLSLALGIPGQHGAERIAEAYRTTAAACARHGKALGIAGISDAAVIARYLAVGARFISAGTDASFLLSSARGRVAELHAMIGDVR
jgi:4-hydroxy-2-oxoheptanedioate aldolase